MGSSELSSLIYVPLRMILDGNVQMIPGTVTSLLMERGRGGGVWCRVDL